MKCIINLYKSRKWKVRKPVLPDNVLFYISFVGTDLKAQNMINFRVIGKTPTFCVIFMCTYMTLKILGLLFDFKLLLLFSPCAYVDPLSTNLTYMFSTLLRDALTEYTYAAELAGLHYDIHSTLYGLSVS